MQVKDQGLEYVQAEKGIEERQVPIMGVRIMIEEFCPSAYQRIKLPPVFRFSQGVPGKSRACRWYE